MAAVGLLLEIKGLIMLRWVVEAAAAHEVSVHGLVLLVQFGWVGVIVRDGVELRDLFHLLRADRLIISVAIIFFSALASTPFL